MTSFSHLLTRSVNKKQVVYFNKVFVERKITTTQHSTLKTQHCGRRPP